MNTPPSPMVLGAIAQIAITVKNLEKAVLFYRDKLGLKLLFADDRMAFFDGGNVRLMMGEADVNHDHHPSNIIYYNVTDIEKTSEELAKNHVKVEQEARIIHPMEKSDLWMAFFRDMDDNIFAIMEEKARA